MSESTIPFQGQTAVMDRPAPDLEPAPDGRGNRTLVLVAGGLAVALVLGLAAYFFVFAGGEDTAEQAALPLPKAAGPAVEAPVVEPVTQPRLTTRSFGRDPFEARIVEPVAPVAPVGAAPTGTTGGTTTTTTSTSDSGTTSTTTGTTDTGGTTPSESSAHTFRVIEVAPDNGSVDVKVDGKLFKNLQAGEVFGTYFKVVLISGQVNSFQFGEEKFNVIGTKRLTIA